ncbi:helix-turn-helix transcriptional regulator [Mycolicibacterium sp.]|uniref:helix-turn-helix domain-containing protein n=1 Tax=Mycolicibacterium sp. TaxID=2320850 RepID=UPI0025F0393E|nr:helix-turn-helix transcriptional regulator [Mycolicibacterium sp.]
MANTDDGNAWHLATSQRIGRSVAARRKELGMTALQLSERCRDLGAPIHRSTITKIENGRPRFDLGELLVLAAALDTSPVRLVYPGPYDQNVEVIPGVDATEFVAAQWFSALVYYRIIFDTDPDFDEVRAAAERWQDAVGTLRTARALAKAERDQGVARIFGDKAEIEQLSRDIAGLRGILDKLERRLPNA